MNSMFERFENLESLNLSSFDTHLVYDMTGMFGGCDKLKDVDISNFDTSRVHEYDRKKLFIEE